MMLLLQAIHLRHNWLTRNRGGEIRIQNWRKKLKKTYSKNRDHSPYSEQTTHFEFEPERKLRGTLKKKMTK